MRGYRPQYRPIDSSSQPYRVRREMGRSESLPKTQLPMARPPMKAASTTTIATAELPRRSPR